MVRGKHTVLYEEDVNRLERIRQYIATHLDETLTPAALSEHFKIGNSTLRRQFTFKYHQSIYDYVLECRMSKAMEMLNLKQSSIKKIARSVGYNSRTSFTHAFIKFYKLPPTYFLWKESGEQNKHTIEQN